MVLNSTCRGVLLPLLAALLAVSFELLAASQEKPKTAEESLALRDDVVLSTVTVTEGEQNLGMDEARLIVVLKLPKQSRLDFQNISLYMQYQVCYQCPLVKVAVLSEEKNLTLTVRTEFAVNLAIATYSENGTVCQTPYHFGEHGVYVYMIYVQPSTKPNGNSCVVYISNPPQNSYIRWDDKWYHLARMDCSMKHSSFHGWVTVGLPSDLGTTTNISPEDSGYHNQIVTRKHRLKSLDTFRGFSLIVMVFVNYGGGGYWFFRHSSWNGLTVADLVFPWFTFIMGTSIPLSMKGQLQRGVSRRLLAFKVIKRTVILFTLGLLISNAAKNNSAVEIETVRIPGVLQRLALTYLVVALNEVIFARLENVNQYRYEWIRDQLVLWPQWIVILTLLTLHLTLTFLLPVPNCPRGYLGPGGLGADPAYYNCTGGAAGYIDRTVFGDSHIYHHPTCKEVYNTNIPYDPEGLLGTLTSILICFLGLQAGKILSVYSDWVQRVKRWIIWAVITGVIAGVLCKFSQNDGWIPVNKNLWSVSFVLTLASMAYILLTILYIIIDVYKIWSGAPFFFIGMNSIMMYMCHELFERYFPVQFHVPDTHAAQLAMACYGTFIWIVMAAVLYHNKIFIAI